MHRAHGKVTTFAGARAFERNKNPDAERHLRLPPPQQAPVQDPRRRVPPGTPAVVDTHPYSTATSGDTNCRRRQRHPAHRRSGTSSWSPSCHPCHSGHEAPGEAQPSPGLRRRPQVLVRAGADRRGGRSFRGARGHRADRCDRSRASVPSRASIVSIRVGGATTLVAEGLAGAVGVAMAANGSSWVSQLLRERGVARRREHRSSESLPHRDRQRSRRGHASVTTCWPRSRWAACSLASSGGHRVEAVNLTSVPDARRQPLEHRRHRHRLRHHERTRTSWSSCAGEPARPSELSWAETPDQRHLGRGPRREGGLAVMPASADRAPTPGGGRHGRRPARRPRRPRSRTRPRTPGRARRAGVRAPVATTSTPVPSCGSAIALAEVRARGLLPAGCYCPSGHPVAPWPPSAAAARWTTSNASSRCTATRRRPFQPRAPAGAELASTATGSRSASRGPGTPPQRPDRRPDLRARQHHRARRCSRSSWTPAGRKAGVTSSTPVPPRLIPDRGLVAGTVGSTRSPGPTAKAERARELVHDIVRRTA